MANFKFKKIIMRSLFQKPATLMYPVVPRLWQERTRGSVTIDEDNCILCGMCQRKCPTDAITVDKAGRTWSIERMKCVQCRSCVDTCPKKCLGMDQQYTVPSAVKITDTVSIPQPAPKPAPAAPAEAAAKPTEQPA